MYSARSRDWSWIVRWWIAQAGLFLSVFALVALSGPGRIDILDGHIRYEVARSLVEHGDSIIRDPEASFTVSPGRDGRRYSTYRFPQSAAGVVAILASDATGPVGESRRRFFFSLIAAAACAVLAATYAVAFRHLGQTPKASLAWAAAGVFCTPSWFYGTSSFDDILGTAAVVLAVAVALASRHHHPLAGASAAGLALGLAFNCKQPLGVFVLPVIAAIRVPGQGWRSQWRRVAIVAAMLAVGMTAYLGYDWYKFPPGSAPDPSVVSKECGPVWGDEPTIALLALGISLGTGVFFYNPTLLISLVGFRSWYRPERVFALAVAAATTVFVLFISLLSFFKGDPAWGPRYLTPIFAVWWIFAPAGSRLLYRWVIVAALGLGLVVQLGALSVDPLRLRVDRASVAKRYMAHLRDLLLSLVLSPGQPPPRDHRSLLDERRDGPVQVPRTGHRCRHHDRAPPRDGTRGDPQESCPEFLSAVVDQPELSRLPSPPDQHPEEFNRPGFDCLDRAHLAGRRCTGSGASRFPVRHGSGVP